MKKNVSLKAIAMQLGVSINTVSHALRDMNDVSEETKTKVRKAAMEMGYMPNHVAQMMKLDERPVVGVFLQSFDNPYYNALNEELRKLFFDRDDYSLVFLCFPQIGVEVIKACVLQRVDLLICFSPPDEKMADFAELNNIDIVCGGSFADPDNKFDHVCVDDDGGCKLAARYLFNPYYKGDYIFVGNEYYFHKIRMDCFARELHTLSPTAKVECFGVEDDDITAICQKIDGGGCRKIFCFNDELAYKLLEKFDERYTDIRRLYPDLDIVGFDAVGSVVCGFRRIPSVMVDYKQLAGKLYELVENRLRNPDSPLKEVTLQATMYRGK